MKEYHLETRAIHAGQVMDETMSRAVPIYRTTAYGFRDSQHGADLFALKESGNIYARLMNPTNDVLEKRMASLEGGVASLSLASGTAAIYFALTNILRTGDELVSANNLYGGTYTMFDALLPQQGITVRMTQVNDFDAVRKAINERTRALYIETVGNPNLDVADVEGYSALAKEFHLPLVVDSTFTPPTLFRPIEYGADVVIHSLSKWIGGHGTGIGGIVTDAGRFDWTDSKFALYNEPDRGYHSLRFGHDLGEMNPLAFIFRLRTVGLRNQGPTLAPDAAWQFIQGMETLPLRMARHCENALQVAKYLAHHEKVDWVRYPSLSGNPDFERANHYFPHGCGGMVIAGMKGGAKSAQIMVDHLPLFSLLANVGDAKSLVIHPASTTHSQLDDSALLSAGIRPEMVRFSIGLEHIDDILDALSQGLDAI